jgi:hypothetical protein
MSKPLAEIEFNVADNTARVTRNVGEPYARALLQKSLKAESGFTYGWVCVRIDYDDIEFYLYEITNRYLKEFRKKT